MTLEFSYDEFNRVACELWDGQTHAVITASDRSEAEQGLLAAVRGVQSTGNGECFWNEAAGQYRWVLRRFDNHMVRVAILWSTGTVTGWQHAFWAETPMAAFCQIIESGLVQLTSRESAS